MCWNTEIGQCLTCSPAVAEEISRAQAAAQVRQIQQQAETVDWTSQLDISTRVTVTCSGCQAKVAGGKFCSSCGTSLVTVTCRSCGFEQNPAGAAFCADCGQSMA